MDYTLIISETINNLKVILPTIFKSIPYTYYLFGIFLIAINFASRRIKKF